MSRFKTNPLPSLAPCATRGGTDLVKSLGLAVDGGSSQVGRQSGSSSQAGKQASKQSSRQAGKQASRQAGSTARGGGAGRESD
eukprot:746869-Hanusia_phi.AAC.2